MNAAAERAALLAGVLAEPDDDGVRLVFADWCEENGEPERAEFVRVQIELARLEGAYGTVALAQTATAAGLTEMYAREESLRRRERELLDRHRIAWGVHTMPEALRHYAVDLTFRCGFVERVECTLADWWGNLCKRCEGRGKGTFGKGGAGGQICPSCRGTGRTGHGSAIVLAQPVCEVRLTDREPVRYPPVGSVNSGVWYAWFRGVRNPDIGEAFNLPEELWALAAGQPGCEVHGPWADFPTLGAAHAALSAALLAWARHAAGLPPRTGSGTAGPFFPLNPPEK